MYAKLLVVIFLRTCTDLSFKAGVNQLDFDSLGSFGPNVKRMLVNPFVWSGLLFGLMNMLFWAVSLSSFDLSYAYPFLSIVYIVMMIAGKLLFGEHIDRYKLIGLLFIVAGAGMLFIR
ncbi:MAG: EamA family transporter [Candidatus Margulisiibacteriota bacterium]